MDIEIWLSSNVTPGSVPVLPVNSVDAEGERTNNDVASLV